MKAIVCRECVDIKALEERGPVECRCGNVEAEWIDSQRGTMRARAKLGHDSVRVLGVHNGFLKLGFSSGSVPWKEAHEQLCNAAKGYLFHADNRNCWVALIRIGESNDTFWWRDDVDNG